MFEDGTLLGGGVPFWCSVLKKRGKMKFFVVLFDGFGYGDVVVIGTHPLTSEVYDITLRLAEGFGTIRMYLKLFEN